MNRALLAVVALIGFAGLTGCTGPFGLFGSAGRTVPPRPSMSGPGGSYPTGPTGSNHALRLAGAGVLTDNVNDSYVAFGTFIVSGTEGNVAIPVLVGGTLSNLEVFVTTAPGTGASWTLTVDKNESATVLTCSVAGVAGRCNDSSPVAVVPGDQIDLGVTPFGTPGLATITWSAKITP